MAKSKALSVSLDDAPRAAEAISLLQQAQGISIIDRSSHEACRTFLKGAKALKREIEEHFEKIKKPINVAKTTVLDLERQQLAPVLEAIKVAESLDTAYVREQQRIEREAADAARIKAEADERTRREKAAAESEAAALKLEESSNVLSERESVVVALFAASDRSATAMLSACRRAGYKDAASAASKLLKSEKFNLALTNLDMASAIRRESEAKQAAPILVDVPTVQSEIGSVAGTSIRKYYGCGEIDLRALFGAVQDGRVPLSAIQPNLVFLNEQARSLKEQFPKVFIGCTLTKRDGITG